MNQNEVTLRYMGESEVNSFSHYAITEGVQENFAFANKEELDDFVEQSEAIGPTITQKGEIEELEEYRVIDWEIKEAASRA